MDDFHHIALDKDSEYLSKIKHLNLGQVVLFSQEETEYFLTHKTQNETDDVLKKDFKHTIVTLSNSNNERRSIPRPKTEIVVEKNGNVFLLAQLGSFELKYGLINTNARIKIEIAIRRYDKTYGMYYTLSGRETVKPFKLFSVDTRVEIISNLSFCHYPPNLSFCH